MSENSEFAVRAREVQSSFRPNMPAGPEVGGSISRFTFFRPSAVRGGPPLTLFTKYDYLRNARGFCQNGWYEHVGQLLDLVGYALEL